MFARLKQTLFQGFPVLSEKEHELAWLIEESKDFQSEKRADWERIYRNSSIPLKEELEKHWPRSSGNGNGNGNINTDILPIHLFVHQDHKMDFMQLQALISSRVATTKQINCNQGTSSVHDAENIVQPSNVRRRWDYASPESLKGHWFGPSDCKIPTNLSDRNKLLWTYNTNGKTTAKRKRLDESSRSCATVPNLLDRKCPVNKLPRTSSPLLEGASVNRDTVMKVDAYRNTQSASPVNGQQGHHPHVVASGNSVKQNELHFTDERNSSHAVDLKSDAIGSRLGMEITFADVSRLVLTYSKTISQQMTQGSGLNQLDSAKEQSPQPMSPGLDDEVSRNGLECPLTLDQSSIATSQSTSTLPTSHATNDKQQIKTLLWNQFASKVVMDEERVTLARQELAFLMEKSVLDLGFVCWTFVKNHDKSEALDSLWKQKAQLKSFPTHHEGLLLGKNFQVRQEFQKYRKKIRHVMLNGASDTIVPKTRAAQQSTSQQAVPVDVAAYISSLKEYHQNSSSTRKKAYIKNYNHIWRCWLTSSQGKSQELFLKEQETLLQQLQRVEDSLLKVRVTTKHLRGDDAWMRAPRLFLSLRACLWDCFCQELVQSWKRTVGTEIDANDFEQTQQELWDCFCHAEQSMMESHIEKCVVRYH